MHKKAPTCSKNASICSPSSIPSFLVEFNENCSTGWKEKRLTDAGVSSFPILCPSYVNLNVPTKMIRAGYELSPEPSIDYKGKGTDRVLSQIVSKHIFNLGRKRKRYRMATYLGSLKYLIKFHIRLHLHSDI